MKGTVFALLVLFIVPIVFGAAFAPQRKYVGFDGTPEIKCNAGSTRCMGRTFQRCEKNDWSTVENCPKTLRCNYKKGCVGSAVAEKKVQAAKERAQKKSAPKKAGIGKLKI